MNFPENTHMPSAATPQTTVADVATGSEKNIPAKAISRSPSESGSLDNAISAEILFRCNSRLQELLIPAPLCLVATSVNKGESIDFYITVNPAPQTFDIKIYRIGYYGGLGGRIMHTVSGLAGTSQSAWPPDATTGLIECHGNRSYTLNVPTDWTSGVYLATLINQDKYANYIIFVVRDDARSADLLYQLSVTTYQDYNKYPNDNLTGKSLYPNGSYGANTISGTRRAVKVSFDRPYMDGGSGQFMSWERYFIKWVERMGYDITYSTNIDTHSKGGRLRNYKGFLSVGHDEYWPKQMYDAAEAARAARSKPRIFRRKC